VEDVANGDRLAAEMPGVGDDGIHPAAVSLDPVALVHAFAKALAEYKAHVDV
jgi:hypothetical protein